jgi:hypothetical protein
MLMAIANWSLQDTTGSFLGFFSVGAMVALWWRYGQFTLKVGTMNWSAIKLPKDCFC